MVPKVCWHSVRIIQSNQYPVYFAASQGRWESQQDIFMPSQFQRTLPRPASSPSTYSTSPSSSSSPFPMTPQQNQEPEQGKSDLTTSSPHHAPPSSCQVLHLFFFSSPQFFFLQRSSSLLSLFYFIFFWPAVP